MSGFLHPAFLWALAGLAIPIGIHLLSRKEGKIIKVGSLRHLRTSEPPSFKSIKFNELLLLVVRCLLLMVMVLFISELIFPNWLKKENKKWVLIDPAIEVDQSVKKVLDSLEVDGYELRWLESGFPEMEAAVLNTENDYWSLANALGKIADTEILVFSGNRFQDFKGKRVSLPENVKWFTMPIVEDEFLAEAVRWNDHEVQIRKGITNSSSTNFEFVKQSFLPDDQYAYVGEDSVLVEYPDTVSISIVADAQYEHAKKIIRASLEAINKLTSAVLDIRMKDPDVKSDWVIWLSDDTPAVSVKCIFYKEDSSAPFFHQISKTQWQITKRLNQEVASNNQLTTTLFDLLISNEAKQIVLKNDKRVLPEPMLWPKEETKILAKRTEASSHQQLLFIVMMVLFLVERTMAFVKKL